MREIWSIEKLKPWTKNPRDIKKEDFERLKRQIKELGQYKPLLVTREGEVLGGNMRLKAYKELGINEVWVSVVTPKTEAEKVKYALSDNDRAGFYISDQLTDLITEYGVEINLDDYKVDLGEAMTLSEVLNKFGINEVVEDEPPEVPEEAESKLGEVYQLGRHRLMCGDATKIEDVEKLMDGKKADMVFTDPPYNVDYEGGTGLKIKNDKFANKQAFYQFLYDSLSALRPFVKGDLYICMSSSELHTLQKAFQDCGGHWSTFIIWVKDRFTLGRSNYQRQYEPILYGWFTGSTHYWSGLRNLGDVVKEEAKTDEFGETWFKLDGLVQGDIWEFDKPKKNKEHPTMKPQELCARAIKNSSPLDGVILDTFGGSGSTLIACEQTNRTCYMMELDPKYCDVITKRWMKFTGKRAYRIIDAEGNQVNEPVKFADENFVITGKKQTNAKV